MNRLFIRLAVVLILASGGALADVTQVDNGDLEALIAAGVPVIDLRTQGEWRDTGVIENSHLMTFFDQQGQYDVPTWMQQLAEIAKPDDPIVLICWTGQRSQLVSQFLDTRGGYARVHNVTRGMEHWLVGGHPVSGF